MTRFRKKIIWYWDYIDCNMYVVLVYRRYDESGKITLYFGHPECIKLSSLGEFLFDEKLAYEQTSCNSSYWNQTLSRYFPKTRYTKSGESYVYDIKDLMFMELADGLQFDDNFKE